MSLDSVVEEIERAGGLLKLEPGEHVRVMLPRGLEGLSSVLREHKPELLKILRKRGGRVAAFPHCPRCAGYALYRQDNIGLFECLSCGLTGIAEITARRLQ